MLYDLFTSLKNGDAVAVQYILDAHGILIVDFGYIHRGLGKGAKPEVGRILYLCGTADVGDTLLMVNSWMGDAIYRHATGDCEYAQCYDEHIDMVMDWAWDRIGSEGVE